MENILSWLGGAFLAYLVLRGIRGMWTKVGCLLLLTQAVVMVHAVTHTIVNNGPASAFYIQVLYQNNTGNAWQIAGNCSSIASGGSCSWNTTWTGTHGWRTVDSNIQVLNQGTWTLDGNPGTYYANTSSPPPDPTWFTNSLSIKNTNWFDTQYSINIYSTNGTLMTNYNLTMMPDVKYDLNFSYTNDFTVTVTGPGDKSTDFEDRVVATTQGESAGTSGSNPSNNNASGSRYDPFADLQANVPTATNQMVADRQNAQGIVNSIDRGLQQLGNQLQSLGTIGGVNGTTYLGQISTNTATSTNQMMDLGAIKTNTAVATNLLTDIKTNALEGSALTAAGGLLSNLHSSLTATASNSFFGEGGYGAGLGSKGSALTNQVGDGWASGSVIDEGAGPLDMFISNGEKTYWLSLNPLSPKLALNPDGIWGRMSDHLAKMLEGLAWLKTYLVGLIFFVMWWWMYQDVQEAIEKAAVPAGMIRPPSADWKGILGSLTWGLLLQTIITTTIMAIPTSLAAYHDNMAGATGYMLPGSGVEASLESGGMGSGSGVALAAYRCMGLVIPFATLFTAAGNYLAFILFKDRLLNWTFVALRVTGNVYGRLIVWGAILAGLSAAGPVCAVELVVNNWTTNAVALTNGQVWTFPPGQFAVNVPAGMWTNAAGSFELPESWQVAYVLAAAQASDGTNISFQLGGAQTAMSSAVEGFGWGFLVFGTFWAVSLVRAGLRVGAGYGEV